MKKNILIRASPSVSTVLTIEYQIFIYHEYALKIRGALNAG